MLKPPNEPEGAPGDNDRPIGELVHELIEDGKAYARAEAEVIKAIVAGIIDGPRVSFSRSPRP